MLNGKSSEWTLILSGVHEWSILGPCALFVVHEYDVQAVIISRIRFFVDDTSLYSVVRDPEKSVRELIRDLNVMNNWPKQWKLVLIQIPPNQLKQFFLKTAASGTPTIFQWS